VAERLCVFCRSRPVDPDWRPFCSERCRLQDLARWADGSYRIPGHPPEPTDPVSPDTRDGESGGSAAGAPRANPEDVSDLKKH
jgi:endogenous inhibitor of DNA gyrase (YacG/DUF329 family)